MCVCVCVCVHVVGCVWGYGCVCVPISGCGHKRLVLITTTMVVLLPFKKSTMEHLCPLCIFMDVLDMYYVVMYVLFQTDLIYA